MEEKISSKVKDLSAELQELRKTNNDLINVNKLLIDENKSLRTAAAVAAAAADFENPSSIRLFICRIPRTFLYYSITLK